MVEAFDLVSYEPPRFGIVFGFIPLEPVSLQDVRLDIKSSEIKNILQ
jgi:hypothetical protein